MASAQSKETFSTYLAKSEKASEGEKISDGTARVLELATAWIKEHPDYAVLSIETAVDTVRNPNYNEDTPEHRLLGEIFGTTTVTVVVEYEYDQYETTDAEAAVFNSDLKRLVELWNERAERLEERGMYIQARPYRACAVQLSAERLVWRTKANL